MLRPYLWQAENITLDFRSGSTLWERSHGAERSTATRLWRKPQPAKHDGEVRRKKRTAGDEESPAHIKSHVCVEAIQPYQAALSNRTHMQATGKVSK